MPTQIFQLVPTIQPQTKETEHFPITALPELTNTASLGSDVLPQIPAAGDRIQISALDKRPPPNQQNCDESLNHQQQQLERH